MAFNNQNDSTGQSGDLDLSDLWKEVPIDDDTTMLGPADLLELPEEDDSNQGSMSRETDAQPTRRDSDASSGGTGIDDLDDLDDIDSPSTGRQSSPSDSDDIGGDLGDDLDDGPSLDEQYRKLGNEAPTPTVLDKVLGKEAPNDYSKENASGGNYGIILLATMLGVALLAGIGYWLFSRKQRSQTAPPGFGFGNDVFATEPMPGEEPKQVESATQPALDQPAPELEPAQLPDPFAAQANLQEAAESVIIPPVPVADEAPASTEVVEEPLTEEAPTEEAPAEAPSESVTVAASETETVVSDGSDWATWGQPEPIETGDGGRKRDVGGARDRTGRTRNQLDRSHRVRCDRRTGSRIDSGIL